MKLASVLSAARASAARAAPSLIANGSFVGGAVLASLGFEELHRGLGCIVGGVLLMAGSVLTTLGRAARKAAAEASKSE